MRKSKLKKQIKRMKQKILTDIVKKEYKGERVTYDMQEDLCLTGHISCGYITNPTYDGKLFYGGCALTGTDCKYPHSNYTGCQEYIKRFGDEYNK